MEKLNKHNKKGYFILFTNKNEKLLCSWKNNEPDYFGQKVNYIGLDGLGGYRAMLSNGWYARLNFGPLYT